MVMLNSLYNFLESDCHQLPKWGRLKEHVLPPCLVLVIDDNLYGLMVALSYIRRVCPLAVQVQVEHHEEMTCLKLVVHCGDNGLVKMC